MENWGAITYNDQALLVTPSSTLADRQNIYSIQAHEMAHQWNGDLVTMGWWDDLWLNESFASWMSAKETAARNPSWQWWEGQDADKETAMIADARLTSHPIHVHITDELQAETAFDSEITYSKEQAFLRMLEAYLTPDVFRAGIRSYVKARAYSNATPADLWLALGKASGKDVAALSSAWIARAGFPLVSVAAACDAAGNRTLALTQKRFLREGSDPAGTTWSIPLAIRSGLNGRVSGMLFRTAGASVHAGRCDAPLTLNAGNVGFFRVAYDDATLGENAAAFGRLPDPDRIALFDDQWALASSGQAPLASFLTLARSMGNDLDARAWEQIGSSLDTLEYYERGTSGYAAFTALARTIVKPLANRLGWDARPNETPGVGNLRRQVLRELGGWGDPSVAAEAHKRFAEFLRNRNAISSDDQHTILGIVALTAGASTFDQLHAIANAGKNETEKRRYYDALMRVRDDALAKRAANIALSSEIPAQMTTARLGFIVALSDAHPVLAWQAMKAHSDALLASYGPLSGPSILAQYVPGDFWNAAPPSEIEAFVRPRISPDLRPMLARGMDDARYKLK